MVSVKDRHKTFIEELQSGIKEFEATAVASYVPEDSDHGDLMVELERKFDELFGTGDE